MGKKKLFVFLILILGADLALAGPKAVDTHLDLHTHSYCSDGQKTPEAMVQMAKAMGMKYFALTDHDTVGCLARAAKALEGSGIQFIPGVEISVEDDSIHMLALGVNPDHLGLIKLLKEATIQRVKRAQAILKHLAGKGIKVRWKEDVLISKLNRERVAEGAESLISTESKESDEAIFAQLKGQITRPDLAIALVAEGHAKDERDAFDRFIGDEALEGEGTYQGPSYRTVIDTIHAAGGIAVLAHPHTIYKFKGFPATYSGKTYIEFEPLVVDLLNAGMDGIEAYRPGWKRYVGESPVYRIAKTYETRNRRKVFLTPGSDYHGYDVEGIGARTLGNLPVPVSEKADLEALFERLAKAPR